MSGFKFYLPDTDRSSGWSNHTYVLQYVTKGEGPTPAEAWATAEVPEGFDLPDTVVAIGDDVGELLVVDADTKAAAITEVADRLTDDMIRLKRLYDGDPISVGEVMHEVFKAAGVR